MATLNLYTFKPNVLCLDESDEREEMYIQGIVEAVENQSCDKLACFLELKKEQVLLLKRLSDHILNRTSGNYFRNHVLLDVLVMYKKYNEEFGEDTAFGNECAQLCLEIVQLMYELFSCTTNIVVLIESEADPEDEINLLLAHLERSKYIATEKVCKFGKTPRLQFSI
ncbi:ORF82 [Agrotis segetum granulovirus]|uniref:ORF82 n=1 Tax=Agrotis segetum granulosis virus TaxID=10464 RepID=Q6QXM2_GVAS|nr:P18 [Agrotis segetum granulovirus]AAS82656.1 ORF82 [Agrotis segetum granulovirus]AHN92133.1 hypothetical protein AsGV094 [Agrotis segetum granulovirus]AKN63370.1 P18 [Agrotis segetum granulovirus]